VIDPHELITIEAGVILELVATVKRLHMGSDQGYRFPPCDVCALVATVEDAIGPHAPAPKRAPRKLQSVPRGTPPEGW
jgi:hypothetical protein